MIAKTDLKNNFSILWNPELKKNVDKHVQIDNTDVRCAERDLKFTCKFLNLIWKRLKFAWKIWISFGNIWKSFGHFWIWPDLLRYFVSLASSNNVRKRTIDFSNNLAVFSVHVELGSSISSTSVVPKFFSPFTSILLSTHFLYSSSFPYNNSDLLVFYTIPFFNIFLFPFNFIRE